jgi:hypothetical protein
MLINSFVFIGGFFHQTGSELAHSKLPKLAISAVVPGSQCYTACMWASLAFLISHLLQCKGFELITLLLFYLNSGWQGYWWDFCPNDSSTCEKRESSHSVSTLTSFCCSLTYFSLLNNVGSWLLNHKYQQLLVLVLHIDHCEPKQKFWWKYWRFHQLCVPCHSYVTKATRKCFWFTSMEWKVGIPKKKFLIIIKLQ